MEFITQNGQKQVEIKTASFKSASNLKKTAIKNLSLSGIKLDNISEINGEILFTKLIDLLISLDSSDEFEKALFECLSGCIYDKFYKITPQFFDDKPESREDYYEIVAACCEENLRPFFKSLVSALKQKFAKTETIENPEQK